jgi:hypothetical protein
MLLKKIESRNTGNIEDIENAMSPYRIKSKLLDTIKMPKNFSHI